MPSHYIPTWLPIIFTCKHSKLFSLFGKVFHIHSDYRLCPSTGFLRHLNLVNYVFIAGIFTFCAIEHITNWFISLLTCVRSSVCTSGTHLSWHISMIRHFSLARSTCFIGFNTFPGYRNYFSIVLLISFKMLGTLQFLDFLRHNKSISGFNVCGSWSALLGCILCDTVRHRMISEHKVN